MTNKNDEPKEIPILIVDENEDEQAEETNSPEDQEKEQPQQQQDPLAALQAQIDTMTQERATLYDQLLRRQAEFENYRRRVDRERSETYTRARAEVLLELLPVIDNFERALASLENSGGDAESLRHGVELIHKQFKDALTKFGLEPVESVGQTFDPHVHEAVTIEPTDKHKENTIIEEFQRGYKLGEKLLRPAKVKVASSPER
ncbi:MAG TPA: nucleotide exchange factor GrpE [Blastocatellia bacterium]|nr:nucleotide exchange factor GrpE [Blastocatellia bacterium]